MDFVVRIDADEIGVKRGMMDLGQGQSIGDQRLPQKFMAIGDDVRGVEQASFGQARDRAAPVVSGEHGFAERGLVEPLADEAERIAALGRGRDNYFACG